MSKSGVVVVSVVRVGKRLEGKKSCPQGESEARLRCPPTPPDREGRLYLGETHDRLHRESLSKKFRNYDDECGKFTEVYQAGRCGRRSSSPKVH